MIQRDTLTTRDFLRSSKLPSHKGKFSSVSEPPLCLLFLKIINSKYLCAEEAYFGVGYSGLLQSYSGVAYFALL